MLIMPIWADEAISQCIPGKRGAMRQPEELNDRKPAAKMAALTNS